MIEWIKNYQVFLFDFDGLLVNTEKIHYMAYKRMCAQRGVTLEWGFDKYCKIAHYSSEGLSEKLYSMYPELKAQQPSWQILYAEKKQAMVDLLKEGAVEIMPGVEKLLTELQNVDLPRCVVTHSPIELITIIRDKHPIFNTIPNWITREHYSKPKPDSECYIKAIEMLAKPNDKVIGFEDTPRGLRALLGTKADAVLICQIQYPEIPLFKKMGALHFPTFLAIPDSQLHFEDNQPS